MASWGRGGMVGVRKAIYTHERTLRLASVILADEHGDKHAPGTRRDLCPKCAGARREEAR
ncbi:MAG: hypothetical protein Q8R92_03055 [Deltaproteobacteria bacterium]|nr:hypothetical protein [Deltaproteobacteria bacterium]